MRETPSQELIDLILHGSEERYLEYKRSVSWDDQDTKAKITKCILGMANLRGGGYIVLGVEQRDGNSVPVGMQPDHARSFSHDKVVPQVNAHAKTSAEIEIKPVPYEGNEFVIIQVREFADVPIICKKDAWVSNNKKQILSEGKIYTRSRRMHETVEVSDPDEMREIVDLAVDKGIRHFAERMARTGILSLVTEPSDAERFDQELGELK
jgi:predicted HTH transcriptional regulator